MPLRVRSPCQARLAQAFSKSNRSRDIASYPTISRPKSQKALPLVRILITFLYNVVIIWVSTAEISRSLRALMGKISEPSRGTSPRSSAPQKEEARKKTFHFRLRLRFIGNCTQRASHTKWPCEIDASRGEPVAVVQDRRRSFTDFF